VRLFNDMCESKAINSRKNKKFQGIFLVIHP